MKAGRGIPWIKRRSKGGWKRRVMVRRGTIARLPKVVRDKLNQMFDDGKLVRDMIKMVKEETGVELKPTMLREWRRGGYRDWQERELRLEDMGRTREFAG